MNRREPPGKRKGKKQKARIKEVTRDGIITIKGCDKR